MTGFWIRPRVEFSVNLMSFYGFRVETLIQNFTLQTTSDPSAAWALWENFILVLVLPVEVGYVSQLLIVTVTL